MQTRKKLVILGATGSIGSNALDVVRAHPDLFEVVALAARRENGTCERLAASFGAKAYVGEQAAQRAVEENEADLCLVATVGLSGLRPTLAAIEKGMTIALATKEVLVMAGALVTAAARRRGVRILPVDSEHSAIAQCLPRTADGDFGTQGVARLLLTASGGPFLSSPDDLSTVTVEQALAHPSWKMGRKVTVDSATMMNKGFEVIEAHWLFSVPLDRIEVVVHPESIVHSLVTFVDGATLAQLSPPDMRVAIQYALVGGDRRPASRAALDLPALGALTFRAPDPARFPALRLATDAQARGGLAPAVLAAADEWAVRQFLAGRIGYAAIAPAVEACLAAMPDAPCESVEAVLEASAAAERWLAANIQVRK